MRRKNYEKDNDTFKAAAYKVRGHEGIAWYVLGWETEPDEDTRWSGYEVRTGQLVAVIVGDDRYFTFDESDITPLDRREYCGECGQIGCGHDGYDRSDEDHKETGTY